MKYVIDFNLRGKKNQITIDYQVIPDAQASGFTALKLPFDIDACVGYPMLHAYFENFSLCGYERYCGWIQIIQRNEYSDIHAKEPARISYELDVAEEMRKRKNPFFAYGYPAEFFDAPCNNLGDCERLDWRAYTYLVDPPLQMNGQRPVFLAGFSWGYTEDRNKNIQLSDFILLSEDRWAEHQKYALFME